MGAYDCDCINNLEYDRRERKAQLSQQGTTSEPTIQPVATDTNVGDTISRQAALDAICKSANDLQDVLIPVYYRDLIKTLPPVQPEPSIPLSWIDEHIEWLKSLDNEFAKLAAAHISVMVQKWRREQNETDCLRGEV